MTATTDAQTFRATHRYARMGGRKARLVSDVIRGMSANEALDVLRHDHRRASAYTYKVLASAVANAMQHPDVRASRLEVVEAFVQDGPLLMGRLRYRPGPMGRAMPIRKRTCHIHVVVADPSVTEAFDGEVDAEEAHEAQSGGEE